MSKKQAATTYHNQENRSYMADNNLSSSDVTCFSNLTNLTIVPVAVPQFLLAVAGLQLPKLPGLHYLDFLLNFPLA